MQKVELYDVGCMSCQFEEVGREFLKILTTETLETRRNALSRWISGR